MSVSEGVWTKSGKMCEMQKLRLSVEQILAAAAEEIFGVFKRSIAEFEEKLSNPPKPIQINPKLPDTYEIEILIPPEQQGNKPHVYQEDLQPIHIKDDQQEELISQVGEEAMKLVLLSECPSLIQDQWMAKDEIPLKQQDRGVSLEQVDPRQWLQGLKKADFTAVPFTPPSVKDEQDEGKAQSLQLHQTEETKEEPQGQGDYGVFEPNRLQNNDFSISNVTCKTTQHQYTKDDKSGTVLSVSDTKVTIRTRKKPFSCSVCNKLFAYKSYLKDHMTVHTGEKPFHCSVCQKGFGHKGNLNKHMLTHTGERPFSCSICNKVFATKSNLKEHTSVHSIVKPFNCSVCKKGFANKSNLNKHMPLHTGKRPFCCVICKKTFAHKWNLTNHLLTHTGPKISMF